MEELIERFEKAGFSSTEFRGMMGRKMFKVVRGNEEYTISGLSDVEIIERIEKEDK